MLRRRCPAALARSTTTALLTAMLLAMPGVSGADQSGIEGRTIAITLFNSIDERRGTGKLNVQDLTEFGETIAVSMDYDKDGVVARDEFLQWDPGFRFVAAELGREEGFVTAQKIVFAMWDSDGDDTLTQAEMRRAMSTDLRHADLDDDGTLDQDEFLSGFLIIVAMRAAIRPDL
ncbi:MAG: hypothetical protein AAGG54_14285 [Pseudomonadota bacterium]